MRFMLSSEQLEGLKLFHLDEGNGNDVAVFIHGFPMNHKLWLGILPNLTPSLRCIAPDLRGFGQSQHDFKSPIDFDIFAEDLASIIKRLGVERVHIIGASFGAMVAMVFAARYPNLIKSLIIFHSEASPDDEAAKATRNQQIETVEEKGAYFFAEEFAAKILPQNRYFQQRQLLTKIMAEAPQKSMIAGLKLLRDRSDLKPLLPTIDVPTLVVAGGDDPNSPPELMKETAVCFPNHQFAVLPETGHLSVLERPEWVTQIILDWISHQSIPGFASMD